MGQPAAKQGDKVMATDTHIVMIPSPGGPVPTPLLKSLVPSWTTAQLTKQAMVGNFAMPNLSGTVSSCSPTFFTPAKSTACDSAPLNRLLALPQEFWIV